MIRPLLVLIFMLFVSDIKAQFNSNSYNTSGYYSGGIIAIKELPIKVATTEGSTYLTDDWIYGNLYIKTGKVINNVKFKLDLQNQIFDILTDEDRVVVLQADLVESFKDDINNDLFVNSNSFQKGNYSNEFFELVVDGEIKLFIRHYLITKKPSYNVAMDVGNKERRIEKKEKELLFFEGRFKTVQGGKKKLAGLFENHKKEALKYIKENNISLNKREEIIELVRYMNETSNQ